MARKSKYNHSELQPSVLSPKKKLQVGIYLRLSVEDGDDIEYNSIGNQRKLCVDYLICHPELELAETYMDNGRSGMNYDRAGFKTLYQDIQNGKIDCVLVKDISRLGRHYLQTSELVMQTFPSLHVRLICVTDGFDSADTAADSESLLMPFKLLMNETYVRDTSKKIRSSIQGKMDAGTYLPSASSVPYGYIRNPENNTYDIDDEAAAVVIRIFELRLEGYQFNQIARLFNSEGIPCPGKLRYDRGITMAAKYANAQWVRGTIRKITSDPVYLGTRIHGKIKRDRLGAPKTRRNQSQWQTVDDAHPPIIDEDLFEAVQEVNRKELEHRNAYQKTVPPSIDYREAFRDVLVCGDCGAGMSGAKVNQRSTSKLPNSVSFNCRSYVYSNRTQCSNHHIRQEVIMGAVRNFLDTQMKLALDLEQFIEDIQNRSEVTQYHKKVNAQLESVRRQRMNAEAKVERLIQDMTEGLIDRDDYTFFKEKYSKSVNSLIDTERATLEAHQSVHQAVEDTEAWIRLVKQSGELPELDRAAMNALFDKVMVMEDRSLHLVAKFQDPYQQINDYLKKLQEEHDDET